MSAPAEGAETTSTGGVRSTVTVLCALPWLPAASIATTWMAACPSANVSAPPQLPSALWVSAVPFAATEASGPASVTKARTGTSAEDENDPFAGEVILTTGGVVSMTKVKRFEDELPAASTALMLTEWVPLAETTVPLTNAALSRRAVTVTGFASVTE